MEPWLDSLSEDWNSEPRSLLSSPPQSQSASRSNTGRRVSNVGTQSRIPHLAHNIRNASSANFLQPRSTRGLAKLKESTNALTERTASSLNAMPSSPSDPSKRRASSTIPRRPSTAFSDSQNSVQRHTRGNSARLEETPEWKRRLQEGEDIASDGFDLFSPSKLEGMFKQSSGPVQAEQDENNEEDDSVLVHNDHKPWNTLNSNAFPLPSENYTSYRTSRTRPTGMDTLEEMDEDEDEGKTFDLSAISSDVLRQGDIKGLVRRRVSDLELTKRSTSHGQTAVPNIAHDPRMRTVSGQREIGNEIFSDVEDSEKSSIRKQALQETLNTDPLDIRRRLHDPRQATSRRSRSRSSDHEISYDAQGLNGADLSSLPADPVAEITSHSLPEDLSMGTQNCTSVITHKPRNLRAIRIESSLLRNTNQSLIDISQLDEGRDFRSSPPPYRYCENGHSRLSISEPTSPNDSSIIRQPPTSAEPRSSGSPLKLFGNRDTYTNNKLMRVLSQFEDEDSEACRPDETAAFRMSNFGKGELDDFGFDKHVERPVVPQTQSDDAADKVFKDLDAVDPEASMIPASSKERSPKRRRTLLKDEVFVDGAVAEGKLSQPLLDNSLAGKKRRDALPGNDAEQASPETLASRPILQPSGSRKSSHSRGASTSETLQDAGYPAPELSQQIAAELESFAEKITNVKHDSRKASLATKDYMEEANKVMEFIRARGKPKPPISEIQEPDESSELDPDAILDLELDLDLDNSTKDSFSRPPSREGRLLPKPDRRYAQHDEQTASHLKKFRDPEDLELLTSTSAVGTLHLVDNEAAKEAALVPVPEDEPVEIEQSIQSEPPGIRILNDNDRKRKHSASEVDVHAGTHSSSDLSRRTVNTSSSSGSGQRGVISHGTISIPDTIGVMTFDHEKKLWVKRQVKAPKPPPVQTMSPESKVGRQEFSEADPFDGIPDLSFDEQKEASWKKRPEHVQDHDDRTKHVEGSQQKIWTPQVINKSPAPTKSSMKPPQKRVRSKSDERPSSKGSEASRHEERLHEGIPSQDVQQNDKQQARVVTIAFSSPIASEIPYVHPPSTSGLDLDEDDPSLLPLDDDDGSVLVTSPLKPVEDRPADYGHDRSRPMVGSLERHEQYRAMTLNRRPVSRIDENDEDPEQTKEFSLVHVKHHELTPLPERQIALRKPSVTRESSILCLTPLSEFTLHQVDRLNHPEESFVAERLNPKTLRQAHGSHALVEDALVKAITDAEPTELFWEQLRRLRLQEGGLTTLHGLNDYCSYLEYLDVRGNKIAQLTSVPISVRSLNISSNLVSDLTSWTHLHNLQTIDVSGNQLESLEAFNQLVHLRHLKASNNKIRAVEGILDLTGLVTLDLSNNDIADVDFHDCDLTSLESLDISSNSLIQAKHLDCLRALKHLDLTENLLEELVIDDAKVLTQLTTLCLAHNKLGELDLTAFPLLERLNLDNNSVSRLHGLGEAEYLAVLSAREQRISSNLINDILTGTHDCTELYLSSNTLPATGMTLPLQPNYTLRCLELASCGVHILPAEFGDYFPNLRVFNLNFNALSDLSPLLGAIKLKNLFLAKNRIKRMRRTCLTLARLPTLRKLDLRDNPLTVGFYGPQPFGDETSNDHNADTRLLMRLRGRAVIEDQKWISLMDEVTWLRRRAMELLLAECCEGLIEMDGLTFDKIMLLEERLTWEKLMGKGVLAIKDNEDKEAKSRVTAD